MPQFPMSFISVDLSVPYNETENRNQYVLTVICMLTNYVFMVPIRTKTNEYLKHVYSTSGGIKYILNDRGGECTRKQFTWLATELGFTKVYTSSFTPSGNLIIERMHSFLKASLSTMICNHNIDWESIANIAAIVYNVFPHPLSG